MEKEIAVYDNYMNRLSFAGLEEKDFDLLMVICSRMRDMGEEVVEIPYEYIMDLMEWDRSQPVERFHALTKRLVEKLRHVGATVDLDENEFVSFNLFSTFRGNKKKRMLTVRTNKDFAYILNGLTANFTKLELKEYASLDGRYAKQLYHQIRQRYKLKGHFWKPDIEEIRRVLSIPEGYQDKEIYKKIIAPSIETLRSCKGLAELGVEVIRSSRRGRPVTGYKFVWTAPQQIPGQIHIDDLQGQKPAKKKAPKKKYIYESQRPAWTDEQWAKFEEEQKEKLMRHLKGEEK